MAGRIVQGCSLFPDPLHKIGTLEWWIVTCNLQMERETLQLYIYIYIYIYIYTPQKFSIFLPFVTWQMSSRFYLCTYQLQHVIIDIWDGSDDLSSQLRQILG